MKLETVPMKIKISIGRKIFVFSYKTLFFVGLLFLVNFLSFFKLKRKIKKKKTKEATTTIMVRKKKRAKRRKRII